MRKAIVGTGLGALVLAGMALVVGAQGPPPPGGFGEDGPGGGPMPGMFQFGGLMGGFGGKTVTGKPVLATITITHTETLPGNSISNTSTGTFARSADGSIYRDIKFTGIGPWVSPGKAQEFAFIRNVSQGMEYIVNVTKGTYQVFPIHEGDGRPDRKADRKMDRPTGGNSANETVNDNPSGSYTDPGTGTVYPVDDRKVTRTIPAGEIGNQNAIVITSERLYSSALELLLENSHSDPRFGTTTYQLSNIGQSPASSLFVPDPSFTEGQGKHFGKGPHRDQKQGPPQN